MHITPEKALSRDRLTAFAIALAIHAGILFMPLGTPKVTPRSAMQILELLAFNDGADIVKAIDGLPVKKSPPPLGMPAADPPIVPASPPLPATTTESEPNPVPAAHHEPVRSGQLPVPQIAPVANLKGFAQQSKKIAASEISSPPLEQPAVILPISAENPAVPAELPRINFDMPQPPMASQSPLPEVREAEKAVSLTPTPQFDGQHVLTAIEPAASVVSTPEPVAATVHSQAPQTSLEWAEVPWGALPLEVPRVSTGSGHRTVAAPSSAPTAIPTATPAPVNAIQEYDNRIPQPITGKRTVSARDLDGDKEQALPDEGFSQPVVVAAKPETGQTVDPIMLDRPAENPVAPLEIPVAFADVETAPAGTETAFVGAGMASAGASTASPEAVLARLSTLVAARKTYPEAAQRRNSEGRVKVSVRISQDGGLKASKIVGRSGSAVLDRAASDLVQQLFPIDLIIAEDMEVVVTIEYKLSR